MSTLFFEVWCQLVLSVLDFADGCIVLRVHSSARDDLTLAFGLTVVECILCGKENMTYLHPAFSVLKGHYCWFHRQSLWHYVLPSVRLMTYTVNTVVNVDPLLLTSKNLRVFWMRGNLPPSSVVVTHDFSKLEVRDPSTPEDKCCSCMSQIIMALFLKKIEKSNQVYEVYTSILY